LPISSWARGRESILLIAAGASWANPTSPAGAAKWQAAREEQMSKAEMKELVARDTARLIAAERAELKPLVRPS
jgi:hypothetical protein